LDQIGSASGGKPARLEVFEYAADPHAPPTPGFVGWGGGADGDAEESSAQSHAISATETRLRAEFEPRLAEETRRSFEAGRAAGRSEGQKAEHDAHAAAEANEHTRRVHQSAELIESFSQARERYLQMAEHEVVELALAVAARILRREAQMDPLLLTGAVRVALGQIAGSTQVRLHVPPDELDLWTEAIALLPNLPVTPQVVPGEGMRLGDCTIETEMGTVDLGVRAQLSEIERGFFDRAGAVHKVAATAPARTQAMPHAEAPAALPPRPVAPAQEVTA